MESNDLKIFKVGIWFNVQEISENMIEKAKHANIVVFYIVGDIIWSAQPIQVSAQGNNGNHSISIRLVLSHLISIYKHP